MSEDANDGAVAEALAAARPSVGGLSASLSQALLRTRLFGAPPPRLGRFELRRKLGAGGVGAVFEGWDPTLGRGVALKVLHEPGLARLVLREARALARLDHPHVVPLYEVGEAEGEPFLCMALVAGGNYAQHLAEHPQLSGRGVLEQLLPVVSALHAAHEAGVIHGDVKLANLLVGADGAVRVTDFGLATLGRRGEAASSRGPRGGTPGYLAPELEHSGPTRASDQYALAVAFEAALVGREVPAAVESVLRRARAAAAEERWSSLGVLELQLRRALDGQQPDAREAASTTLASLNRTTPSPQAASVNRSVPVVVERSRARPKDVSATPTSLFAVAVGSVALAFLVGAACVAVAATGIVVAFTRPPAAAKARGATAAPSASITAASAGDVSAEVRSDGVRTTASADASSAALPSARTPTTTTAASSATKTAAPSSRRYSRGAAEAAMDRAFAAARASCPSEPRAPRVTVDARFDDDGIARSGGGSGDPTFTRCFLGHIARERIPPFDDTESSVRLTRSFTP